MKKLILLFVLIVLSCVATNTPPTSSPNSCDESLWAHVYHPARLQVIQPCVTVTGTIDFIKPEPDGDLHIRLHLDAGQENLLNDKNIAEQQGDLVLEPVCVGPVTQSDAIDACAGFQNPITIPQVGQHVRVTGTYVLDSESAHGWNEIHPVSSMTVIT